MSAVSRTAQFAKVFKVLKKHYKPVPSDPQRPVLENLLLACCLEDAHYEAANEAYAAMVHTFFDWNEVRVTTISELSETLGGLPDPRAAANRLKRVLQSVFEATFGFDLEEHRKKNLGPTIKWLKKLDGVSDFAVAYVVQSALAGHAIPVDSGTLAALRIVGLVCEKDAAAGVVPGLERAIAKAKGVEFGSLLHQLGADFTANPYSPSVHKILLEIEPDAKDRLPKRRASRRPAKEKTETALQGEVGKAEPAAPPSGKKAASRRKTASTSKQKPAAAAQGKTDPTRGRSAASKHKAAAAKTTLPPDPPKKKSPAERISKRKPR